MIIAKLALNDEEVAALRHWYNVAADFGEVEHSTGVDLLAVLDRLAREVAK